MVSQQRQNCSDDHGQRMFSNKPMTFLAMTIIYSAIRFYTRFFLMKRLLNGVFDLGFCLFLVKLRYFL